MDTVDQVGNTSWIGRAVNPVAQVEDVSLGACALPKDAVYRRVEVGDRSEERRRVQVPLKHHLGPEP